MLGAFHSPTQLQTDDGGSPCRPQGDNGKGSGMNRQNTKNPGSAQCSALGESFGNEISKSVSFADASESVKSAHTYTPPGPSEILASAAMTTILIRYMGIVGSRLLARTFV